MQSGETLTTATIRHCLHLVNFCIGQNDRLYIVKELDGFMDHEPIKITIFITNVLFNRLKWRARHRTPALVVAVTDNINKVVVALRAACFRDLFLQLIFLPVSRLKYVESLITLVFIIGMTSWISPNALIILTLLLHGK